MNPEFFISPVFFVLVTLAVALLTAGVLWLLRDGPNAKRAGMIDLTGAKPRGMTWDFPHAPGVITGELTLPPDVSVEQRARFAAEFAGTGVRIVDEPLPPPMFQIFGPPHDPTEREPDRRQWFGV